MMLNVNIRLLNNICWIALLSFANTEYVIYIGTYMCISEYFELPSDSANDIFHKWIIFWQLSWTCPGPGIELLYFWIFGIILLGCCFVECRSYICIWWYVKLYDLYLYVNDGWIWCILESYENFYIRLLENHQSKVCCVDAMYFI